MWRAFTNNSRKNDCKTPLDFKEIKPVNPKGNESWIYTLRVDAETEVLILWPPDVNNWLIGKDPDARKNWRQEEKGMTEDEMVGWHHWFSVYEFEQALGDGEGWRSLACCSPWYHKESDITDRLNNNNSQNEWSSWAQVETMLSYGSVWWWNKVWCCKEHCCIRTCNVRSMNQDKLDTVNFTDMVISGDEMSEYWHLRNH